MVDDMLRDIMTFFGIAPKTKGNVTGIAYSVFEWHGREYRVTIAEIGSTWIEGTNN